MTSGSVSFWVRWRVRSGYPLALISLYFARPSYASIAAGAVIALIGLAIRCSAAGIVHKSEELAISGPYAWTRNPLYLGSTVLAAGFALGAHSWIVAAVIAAYFAVFYPAVIQREEAYLRERFGKQFDDYTVRVSVFLPWPTPQSGTAPDFSWAQYMRNHEYRAAIGTAASLAILFVRMWIRIRFNF